MPSRKKIIILIISFSLFSLSAGNSAKAQQSTGGSGWSMGNIAEFGLPSATATNIIGNIALWLLGLFALLGVIGFIISGIMYLVSTGNEEVTTKAKRYMMYSIIGVIVGLSGYVILEAVFAMLNASSMSF